MLVGEEKERYGRESALARDAAAEGVEVAAAPEAVWSLAFFGF
jgi:hypothetical protein